MTTTAATSLVYLSSLSMLTLTIGSPILGMTLQQRRFSRDHYAREFSAWQYLHGIGLDWDDKEWSHRLDIFAAAHDFIEQHNAAANSSFTLAHNQFSHLTREEWRRQQLGFKKPAKDLSVPRRTMVETDPLTLASEVDWVSAGAVTVVKNQGSCGSCWSFSTTGAIEGAYFVANGELVSLSEQQLVSCDSSDAGCNGGQMDQAFKWVEGNGGLCKESDYPYASSGGSAPSCQTSCSVVSGTAVTGYTDVASSTKALKAALNSQPVSVAIEADQSAFQYYSSGVLTGTCGTNLDHGVLAVGYGTSDDGVEYWKVKNSWGDSWGEEGYIRIERGSSDECGVLMDASFPSL